MVMSRNGGLRVVCLIVACFAGSCSHQLDPYIMVEVSGQKLSIFSYTPVRSVTVNGVATGQQGFGRFLLPRGEAVVVLEDGSTIRRSGDEILVNGTPIPPGTLNVCVGKDGSVAMDQFIGSF